MYKAFTFWWGLFLWRRTQQTLQFVILQTNEKSNAKSFVKTKLFLKKKRIFVNQG